MKLRNVSFLPKWLGGQSRDFLESACEGDDRTREDTGQCEVPSMLLGERAVCTYKKISCGEPADLLQLYIFVQSVP